MTKRNFFESDILPLYMIYHLRTSIIGHTERNIRKMP